MKQSPGTIIQQKQKTRFFCYLVLFLVISWLGSSKALAQSSLPSDSSSQRQTKERIPLDKGPFTITTLGFGGTALKFTRLNNKFAVMTGGRGSATINKRYNIGGGGYGTVNAIRLDIHKPDTFNFFKMGYGGLEIGYIFYPGEKLSIGTNLLLAGGAAFKESIPESGEDGLKVFPVLEPALFGEIALGRLLRLQAGISYRYVTSAKLDYIADQDLRGFTCFVNLLFGTCNCD